MLVKEYSIDTVYNMILLKSYCCYYITTICIIIYRIHDHQALANEINTNHPIRLSAKSTNSEIPLHRTSTVDESSISGREYPEDKIKALVRLASSDLKSAFAWSPLQGGGIDGKHINYYNSQEDIGNANDDPGDLACPVKKTSVSFKPRFRKNLRNIEKLIVNVDGLEQYVGVEICANPNEACDVRLNVPAGHESICMQKYAIRKLLTFNEQVAKFEPDLFRFQSCCVCHLRYKPMESLLTESIADVKTTMTSSLANAPAVIPTDEFNQTTNFKSVLIRQLKETSSNNDTKLPKLGINEPIGRRKNLTFIH